MAAANQPAAPGNIKALIVIYLGFVSLGLPDTVLGVAWPEMRRDFAAPMFWAGLLAALTTGLSAAASLSAGTMVKKCAPGLILTAAALTTALAMLGYGLAPGLGTVFFFTLFFGLGQGAVDTALNTHMADHHSARQMNWAHGCWGLGAAAGPLVFTCAFGLGFGWRGGYLALFAIQASLALFFFKTLKYWPTAPAAPNAPAAPRQEEAAADRPSKRRLGAGVLFYFFYSGVETVAGLWAASYMTGRLGSSAPLAGAALTGYWASLTLGRFATGWAAGRLKNAALTRLGLAAVGLGLAAMLFISSPLPFGLALILTGLGLAPLYPTMMHETPRRCGPDDTGRAVGLQVGAALAGAALLPPLAGLILSRAGLDYLPLVLLFSAACLALSHELSTGVPFKGLTD